MHPPRGIGERTGREPEHNSASVPLAPHEAGFFEVREVFHDSLARHRQVFGELPRGCRLAPEVFDDAAARRVRERVEDVVGERAARVRHAPRQGTPSG